MTAMIWSNNGCHKAILIQRTSTEIEAAGLESFYNLAMRSSFYQTFWNIHCEMHDIAQFPPKNEYYAATDMKTINEAGTYRWYSPFVFYTSFL